MSKNEWPNSKCDWLYYENEAPDVNNPVKVIMENGEIEVSYESEGEWYSYKGPEVNPGHYELHGVGYDGRATLHHFPGGRILEGYWTDEGYRGMWRIQLA